MKKYTANGSVFYYFLKFFLAFGELIFGLENRLHMVVTAYITLRS